MHPQSATNAGTFVADRQALLGAGTYDEPGVRGRLLARVSVTVIE